LSFRAGFSSFSSILCCEVAGYKCQRSILLLTSPRNKRIYWCLKII
jgi:hypothetical protein